ncbi:MAG TPA: ferrochelatase [Aldersonia sp.]
MTDAILLLSFGGPERPEDVMPFLENVTRGRGVPRARLEVVAQHYYRLGGVSPINGLNRAIIAGLKRELAAARIDLPVYFGNRNWHPLIEDTLAEMRADGVDRALVFATSAWAGYSGCRQYHEDIARARFAIGPRAPSLTKLRQYHDHPRLIDAIADAIRAAYRTVPPDARLVFTAHSVPVSADVAAGPPEDGGRLYRRQVGEAARLCAAAAGVGEHDLVWQSRSGPPQVPWLEPDILDHLEALHRNGTESVVVCPVGFVSDHLEVVWDLDHEAADKAKELGMAFARAATPGSDPRFARIIVELVREVCDGLPARRIGTEPAYGVGVDGAVCRPGCCGADARAQSVS